MKPTKNRFYCNDARRLKMLFETEDKAKKFISFNQEEIEATSGISPKRVYHCIFCGGYHITSQETSFGKSKNEVILENYIISQAKYKIDFNKFNETLLKMNNEDRARAIENMINEENNKLDRLLVNNLEKENIKQIRTNIIYLYTKRKEFNLNIKPIIKKVLNTYVVQQQEDYLIWYNRQK